MIKRTPAAETLAQLNVLITRPQHSIADLRQCVIDQQCNAIELPCLAINPISCDAENFGLIKQYILDLDLFDIIICVSTNAARIAGQMIDQYWPQLPLGLKWFAIGKASAQALAHYDISAQVCQGLSESEVLLAHPELQNISAKKILILKGSAGRELLTSTLQTRSAIVSEAPLYNRAIPVYTDQQINEKIHLSNLSATLITSGEALKNLTIIAQGNSQQFSITTLLATDLIVPSRRVANIAKALGYQRIFVANAADNKTMLAKLLSVKGLEANHEKTTENSDR